MNNQRTLERDDRSAIFQQFLSAFYDSQPQAEETVELGLHILKTGDFQQRWEVAKRFPKLGTQVVDPLLTLLNQESANLESRWFAGRILEQFEETRIILAFIELLQTTDEEELLMMAAEALGNMGNSAIGSLEELLTNNTYKLLAVKALGKIRHADTIVSLLKVVDDPNPEIRAIALEALGSFHQVDLIPVFIKALHDPVVAVRKEAIIALGMQPEFKAEFDLINHLTPLLYDLNLGVCQQAAFALGRMQDPAVVVPLSKVLNSDCTPVALQQVVIQTLNWLENDQALGCLQEFLTQKATNPDIIQTIIRALGEQTQTELKQQATQILINFLQSENAIIQDKTIKQAVAVSLGELGDTMAIHVLNELAEDAEKSVQLHAIAALKKVKLKHNQENLD